MMKEVYFGFNVGSNDNRDSYKLDVLPSFVVVGVLLRSSNLT